MKEYHFDIGDLVYVDFHGDIDVGICVEKTRQLEYRFHWQREPTSMFYNQEDIRGWFEDGKCHAKRFPVK